MSTVLDFSAAVPRAIDIKNAGHSGAVMYISPARESWMGAKPVQRNHIDDFDTHGLKSAFVWQYGKEKNPDVMRGYQGGVADAKAAQKHLNAIKCSGHPVFFAVDFDISLHQWNSVAVEYFKGACSVLGRQRVGIYGHSRVVAWAQEDGVVAEVAPGRCLGWVTRSWSNGETGRDYAVLYQRIHNAPGPSGVQVDINDVLHPEWGWRAIGGGSKKPVPAAQGISIGGLKPNPAWRGDPVWLPEVLRAFGCKVEERGDWKNIGHGDFGAIKGIVVHHTGTNNDIPDYIQNHPQLGLCSQAHLSRSGVWQIVGAGIAWHAGLGSYPGWATNNANSQAIGIEAASAGQTWGEGQLDSYYRGCAAILWFLGKDATPDNLIAHHEYSGRAQGKWDPGLNGKPMDMTHFRAQVQKYIDAARNGNLAAGEEDELKPDERAALNEVKHMLYDLGPRIKDVEKRLDDVIVQVFGPTQEQRRAWGWKQNPAGGRGWEQLGTNERGQWLNWTDSLADTRKDVDDIARDIQDIKQKIA